MRNDHNHTLSYVLENGVDIFLNSVAFFTAYMFSVAVISPVDLTPDTPEVLITAFLTIVFQSLVFMAVNVYKPIPFIKTSSVLRQIIKVNTVYFLIVGGVSAAVFNGPDRNFALLWILLAGIISTALLLYKKRMMIRVTKYYRKKKFKLRQVIIVGDNNDAIAEFLKHVSEDTQSELTVIGYIGDRNHTGIKCDRLGSYRDMERILDSRNPTEVVFAIDAYDRKQLIKMVNLCDDRCIKVYFIPVSYGYFKTARQIEPIGTLPMINIHATPLDNKLNAFVKRMMDIVGSLVLIILTLPLMLIAAVGVYLSSPGPIFIAQKRVGRMGKQFTMLKFRSMKVNAESDTGWTTNNDERKTRFGTILRKTAVDELPQLFNILLGSMSLVGPRPELPHFVEQYKDEIPLYMAKHYVKPGLTGLAQILGLRGDTSVTERIEKDIEYIENWSLSMDIAILLKTPFKAFNPNEKYVKNPGTNGESAAVENSENVSEPKSEHTTDGIAASSAEPQANEAGSKGKILYAASVMSHITNFHLQYIERLRREGYTVHIMARGEGATYNMPFEKKFFSSSNKACRSEIRKIIERERYDTIILNTSLAAFHIRFALPKKNRPKVVNIVHGYLFSKNTSLFKRTMLLLVEKLVASRTDSIIVMNDADRETAERHKLCLGKVYVSRGMGAGVRDVIVHPDKLRNQLGCHDKYVLAFVGELSARKNQAFLIKAMNGIKERIPNAVLWLVGDGLEREALTRLASEIDLSSSVFFLGQKEEACDYMRACDLYVSASMIEGMPFNIIEAMGCKKTVLASDVKGHTDLINDGECGFLYRYNDMREFIDKVVAIHDGELHPDPEKIYQKYKEFDNDSVFEETYKLIKESFEG